MKITTATLAPPLLVLFITWLSLCAIDSGAARFDLALDEVTRITETEAALHRDVLSARIGLLRNYDPLVRETNALDAEVERLRTSTASDTAATAAIDRLAGAIARQEDGIEQFKSMNALLQNSLAYFAMFSANITRTGQNDPLAPTVSMLAAAMLRFTLDTSPAAALAVQTRLDRLARQIPPGATGPAAALLAHGRLLHDLLPAVDGILRSLCSTPRRRDRMAVRTIILARQHALRLTARRFRLVLYVTALVLVGLLAYAGMQLRFRARAMQRRAAFEHVLTAVSMRFVAAPAAGLESVIEAVLEEMGRCVSAERVYFVTSDPADRVYRWCASGSAFPPGWPEAAPQLARRDYPSFGQVLQVVRVCRLPPGTDRDALRAVGMQGWACVTARDTDGKAVLLGFDAVTHPCQIMREGELGLLRTTLDMIANALGRRTLEQERARLELRLQQAHRLETVGALASGIAHNFNNIIGAILGYAEMANERHAPSRMLDEIRRAAERARELVDQILTFAGRRDARRGPVDMHVVIAEATSLLRASLPATVELSMREASVTAVVFGVHTQLLQVVLNLCNNAAQAMEQAGRVELDVTSEEIVAPRALSHGSLAVGRFLRIAVGDSGSGIDRGTLDRIFEPFFTTRAAGNGLGLATTREIVHEHGGAMHVQSTPPHGSRFEVWLPCIDAAVPDSFAETDDFPFGHGETVLLLEADPDHLLQGEELLAAVGYEPVGFTSLSDARAACVASPERFDAAVIGHVSPPGAILELATALRGASAALPILLATAPSEAFGPLTLVDAGISEVVCWPIRAAEIAVALQDRLQAIGRRRTRPVVG